MSWKIDNGDELVVGTVIMGLLTVGLLQVTRRQSQESFLTIRTCKDGMGGLGRW